MPSDSRKERIRKHLRDSSNGSDFIPSSKMRQWPSRATEQPISPMSEDSLPESSQPETEDNLEPETPVLPAQELTSSPVESEPSPVSSTPPTEEEIRKRKVQEHLEKSSDYMKQYFVKDDGQQKEKIVSHLRQIFSQSQ